MLARHSPITESTRRRTKERAVRGRYELCGANWATPMAAILEAVQTEHVRPKKAGRSDRDWMLWPPGRAAIHPHVAQADVGARFGKRPFETPNAARSRVGPRLRTSQMPPPNRGEV